MLNTQKIKTATHLISVKWKVMVAVLLIQIPFFLLLFMVSKEMVTRINDQLAESQFSALDVFCGMLEDQFASAGEFLFVNCYSEEAFAAAGEAESSEEISRLLETVRENAQQLIHSNKSISAVVLQAQDKAFQEIYLKAGTDSNEGRFLDVANTVIQQSTSINLGWTLYSVEERPYLVRCCNRGDLYALVIFDLAAITEKARVDYKLSASVAFREGDTLLTSALWTRDYAQDIRYDESSDGSYCFVRSNNRPYLVTERKIVTMTAMYASDYLYNWEWLYIIELLLVGVMLISFMLALLYLQHMIFKPLNDLWYVMQKISAGDATLRAPNSGSKEFAGISQAFNSMLDTLNELKISTYESQLEARHFEMDAMRLQIRRHFFLNCLKNIYAMASSEEIEQIKQVALLLSNHLRYTLDFNSNTTDLATELKMCENYMQLQGVGQEIPPLLLCTAELNLKGFAVPPVSLLTLLENCCKYASRQEHPLLVQIKVAEKIMDDKHYVSMVIQDNGTGFSQELLDALNNDLKQLQAKGHVGVYNVVTRMKMLYGEECEAFFMNKDGAYIEIIIPKDYDKQDNSKGENDEAIDC